MPEIQVPSEKKVIINIAPFEDAMALKSAVGKVIADSDFHFNFDPKKDLNEQDIDVAVFAKIIAMMDSNAEIQNALMKCLVRCTYDSEKITKAAFEPAEAREDYYPIVLACLKENLLPFFKSLISRFSPAIQAITALAMEKAKEKSPE